MYSKIDDKAGCTMANIVFFSALLTLLQNYWKKLICYKPAVLKSLNGRTPKYVIQLT